MAYSASAHIGVNLNANDGATATHKLGTAVLGTDGHKYVYAKSAGTIAAATAVVLTETAGAFTFAAGAGAWTTVVASVSGDYCWLQATTI